MREVSDCARVRAGSAALLNHGASGEPLLPTGQPGVRGVGARQPALGE